MATRTNVHGTDSIDLEVIAAKLPGVSYHACIDRQSGELVLDIDYCGKDPDALRRAAAFLTRLSKRLRDAALSHKG